MIYANDLFDLSECRFADIFSGNVWDALSNIKSYIEKTIKPNVKELIEKDCIIKDTVALHEGELITGPFSISGDATKTTLKVIKDGKELKGASVIYAGTVIMNENVQIGSGVIIEPGAYIKGPTIIGNNTEVRQGAYMRGSCLIGERVVVGHTTEVKNVIMMNDAKAGHFAYLGDSILGNNNNLGAGTKLANLKIRGATISIQLDGEKVDTGLRKMGAILGDNVEIGCNTVTNPGVILGKGCMVYPNTSVKVGYYPKRRIITSKI